MRKMTIDIPFLDGILDYDCRRCRSGCCRGGNIAARPKEKALLLAEFPEIIHFLKNEEPHLSTFHKYRSCWFLDPAGRCAVQVRHGESSKPFICRLHPFYVWKTREGLMVVPSGCPDLRVAPEGRRGQVGHAPLRRLAREAAAVDFLGGELDWSTDRLELERRILRGSRRFLANGDYLDFAAFQAAAASGRRDRAALKTDLAGRLRLWAAFLGTSRRPLRQPGIVRELTALTPLLRAKNGILREMDPAIVPRALTALYLFMLFQASGKKQPRFFPVYEDVLADLPLGLIYLTEKDLALKDRPYAEKLVYLRRLMDLHGGRYQAKSAAGKS